MKTAEGRIVIASLPNSHGTRIYVPEKVLLDGTLYVQPYRFYLASIHVPIMAGIYVSALSTFYVETGLDTITVTEPFTQKLIDAYYRAAAAKVWNSGQKYLEVNIQDVMDSIPPPQPQKGEDIGTTLTNEEKWIIAREMILRGAADILIVPTP